MWDGYGTKLLLTVAGSSRDMHSVSALPAVSPAPIVGAVVSRDK